MLRADMDALLMKEASGLPFASKTDCAHTCGHDFHAAMLLTAAKMLKENESKLEGTIRTNNPESRELLVRRMKEAAAKTAEVYGGSVEIEMISEVPPLICDPKFTEEIIGYMKELNPQWMAYPGIEASASEDFAVIAEKVPSAFMYLSAGFTDERGQYSAHQPQTQFNEDVCPMGASCLAHCATEWLKNNKIAKEN